MPSPRHNVPLLFLVALGALILVNVLLFVLTVVGVITLTVPEMSIVP